MDGVFVPFLPTWLWLIACALMVLLLLVIFGYHIYQRARMRAITGDSASGAELASRKEVLEADVAALRNWIKEQKNELSLLEGERHQQELIRAELLQIEQKLAASRQDFQDTGSKLAEFEEQIQFKKQTITSLERIIGDLEGKKEEAIALNQRLEDLRRETETAKVQMGRLAEMEAKHAALSVQSHVLAQDIEAHKQELTVLREEKIKTQDWLAKARQVSATERGTHIALQQEIEEQRARKEALKLEIDRLEGKIGGTSTGVAETPYADLFEVPSACLSITAFKGARSENAESTLLTKFKETLASQGVSSILCNRYSYSTTVPGGGVRLVSGVRSSNPALQGA